VTALGVKATFRYLARVLGRFILIFGPAQTLDYWQAWVYATTVSVVEGVVVVFVVLRNPELAQRRIKIGVTAEKRPAQKAVMAVVTLFSGLLLVVPALDHRFGWSHVPPTVVLAADGLVLVAMVIVFWVFKENSFASATVTVSPEQVLVSTGPYAFVRHPMYFGLLLMQWAVPLALCSWRGWPISLVLNLVIVYRLLDEEKLLREKLGGYAEYCLNVPYRLLPRLW